MYLPWNVPVEALGQTFEFREVESRDKAIAPSLEGEIAGDGDGDGDSGQYGDDGDVGNTMSGNSIHSKQVKVVLLAAKSQHMHYDQRT